MSGHKYSDLHSLLHLCRSECLSEPSGADKLSAMCCRGPFQIAADVARPGILDIKGIRLHERVRRGTFLLDDAQVAGLPGNKQLNIDVREPVLVESGSPLRMHASISSLEACQNGSAITPAALQLELRDAHGNLVSFCQNV